MASNGLDSKKQQFRQKISEWYSTQGRKFPWRSSSNPYSILIAEMMLRRTTAVAVNRVYPTFMMRFKTPEQLARARLPTIESVVTSLGLQKTRSQHLKAMATVLVKEYDGNIPTSLDELAILPGVGLYVASAVLNFAYFTPVPLVDGNVLHLVSRIFGIDFYGPTDERAWEFMNSFHCDSDCRSFYWGVIDLVALLCLRRSPKCSDCPLTGICIWYVINRS